MRETFKQWLLKYATKLPVKILAGLILFYVLFGYFAVNPLAQQLAPWYAENHLASKISIGKVTFDPLRLKTTIDDFALTEKSGAPLLGFKKLVVDLELMGLLERAWLIKDIELDKPHAELLISKNGKLNWDDLIAKLNENPSNDNTIPRVKINHLNVSEGGFRFEDTSRPKPFITELKPLAFELDGFSTLPKDRGEYLISATFKDQGGTLKWRGDIAANPVASKGSIALENLKLDKLLQVIKMETPILENAHGDISSKFSYAFSLIQDKPKLSLENLSLATSTFSGDMQQVGRLSASNASLSLPHMDLAFQKADKLKIQLDNISLVVKELGLIRNEATLSIGQFTAKLPQLVYNEQMNNPNLLEQLNVELNESNLLYNKQPLLRLPKLNVNNISLDSTYRQVAIEQINLPKGEVWAKRDKSGLLDWQKAFSQRNEATTDAASPTENPSSDKPFALAIHDIQLQHWRVNIEDASFVHPMQIQLADFNLGFAVNSASGNPAIENMQASATGISAKSNNQTIASANRFELTNSAINFTNQKVDVQGINLSGIKTNVILEKDKSLNWQSILSSHLTTNHSKSSSKGNDWALNIKNLAMNNGDVHIEDRSLITPVTLDIEQANAEVHGASLDTSRPLPIKASFKVKQGGQFIAQGKLAPQPLKGNFDVKMTSLALNPFSAYLNQFALLKLSDGNLEIDGKLNITSDKAFKFGGGFSINKLALVEEMGGMPFIGWNSVSSNSLDLSVYPNSLHMQSLKIVQPIGKFIIYEDKSTNISRILRNQSNQPVSAPNQHQSEVPKSDTALTDTSIQADNTSLLKGITPTGTPSKKEVLEPPTSAENNAPDAFPVNIDSVQIENSGLEFADLSLTPKFGTVIHELSGFVNGVSSNPTSTAMVELDGKVNEFGSARMRGSLQPFKATNFTDIKLAFTNLDMSRLTPYSGKFAGRKIESGKLSVDLEYKIKNRQLTGENKFVIHKIKLGERVDGKDVVNLPLDLAIAILEDTDGVIDLDLPISGSLDDPKFSYGSIVWKAIKNVLFKIVTSPFRAFGKLFGDGGDKLEAITFESGSAQLNPPEMEKIKSISTILNKRHGLTLGINAGYDASKDTRSLQELALRKRVADEIGVKTETNKQAGPIDLNNPKVQKAIDSLYDDLTNKGLLKRLASKFEKPEAGHFEEAQEKLTVSMKITETDLQALAHARADAIKKALVDAGIAEGRIHIDSPVKASANGNNINTKLTLDIKKTKDAGSSETEPAKTAPDTESK